MKWTRRTLLAASGAAISWFLAPLAKARRPDAPEPTPTPAPEGKPEVLARAARERYGKFLSTDELKALEEKMVNLERRSSRLRAFKLSNAEEPATDFRTVRR